MNTRTQAGVSHEHNGAAQRPLLISQTFPPALRVSSQPSANLIFSYQTGPCAVSPPTLFCTLDHRYLRFTSSPSSSPRLHLGTKPISLFYQRPKLFIWPFSFFLAAHPSMSILPQPRSACLLLVNSFSPSSSLTFLVNNPRQDTPCALNLNKTVHFLQLPVALRLCYYVSSVRCPFPCQHFCFL